jgi:hypothetical protein
VFALHAQAVALALARRAVQQFGGAVQALGQLQLGQRRTGTDGNASGGGRWSRAKVSTCALGAMGRSWKGKASIEAFFGDIV